MLDNSTLTRTNRARYDGAMLRTAEADRARADQFLKNHPRFATFLGRSVIEPPVVVPESWPDATTLLPGAAWSRTDTSVGSNLTPATLSIKHNPNRLHRSIS